MRKAFRHTGVLMMLAVVALGLLGAAYTLWYEDLTLTATVDTGILDVDWSLEGNDVGGTYPGEEIVFVLGQGEEPGPGNVHLLSNGEDNVPDSKYTQTCSGTLPTDDDGLANGNTSTLSLTLGGLYPYAGCQFTIDIHNDGTVPVHFGSNEVVTTTGGLDPEDISAAFLQCTVSVAQGAPNLPADIGFNAAGVLVYTSSAGGHTPGNPVQLHTSGRIICEFTVWLNQSAGEDASATYTATITGFQWNETPSSFPVVP